MADQLLKLAIEFDYTLEGISVEYVKEHEYESGEALMTAAREILAETTVRLINDPVVLLEGDLVASIASEIIAYGTITAEKTDDGTSVEVSLVWGTASNEGMTPLQILVQLSDFLYRTGNDMMLSAVSQGHPWEHTGEASE